CKICQKYSVSVKEYIFNPTGKFLIGGFDGDAGLTGRKSVVDSYHSFAPVGGGAFSGKDPSKVDRSAAYMARAIAKYFVFFGGYKWCQVQLSYAIGLAEPMGIQVKTDRGYVEVPEVLYKFCTPKAMIKQLGLLNIKYQDRAKFGHFGALTNSQGEVIWY
ncbi:MAG: methionine adenosyltransferase domain-containing protein, partial [Cellulosilyticum sp.]|nr:methionine adenosyltransferase domain-containing protein [Cellulosilyticum sp.]